MLYRSYVRERISPPKKTGKEVDWEALGTELLHATMPIFARTFAEATQRDGDLPHGHRPDFDCGNPDCDCRDSESQENVH